MTMRIAAGVIFIAAAGFFIFPQDRLDACVKLSAGQRSQCFQEAIEQTAKEGDLPGAFALLTEAYSLDAEFAKNCHGSAHELGKIAYGHFAEGTLLTPTSLASACGYGFYHGFMESMLLESGDVGGARSYCRAVGERLKAESLDAEGACYHGIGHGAVDGTDPRLWGNPQAVVDVGLSLCERTLSHLPDLPPERGPLYRCATGAYNALEILSADDKYRLEALVEDPFGFCAVQNEKYREGCFTNMLPLLWRTHPEDFETMVERIRHISLSPEKQAGLIGDLYHEYVRRFIVANPAERGIAIASCQKLEDPFRLGCIGGLSGGELKYGPPQKEYEGMLALCAQEKLADDEHRHCYRYGLSRLRNFYSSERTQEICALAPQEYQRYCSK